ncbi:MAG: ThiF family adenylyltransferase [Candidatus Thorarchaeota archaeon]
MDRDIDKIEMYSRMLALRDFTEEDLDAIENTTVTVVGAGGLGSPVLRLLTAIGFGKVRVIDHDIVELSNLQRQTIYTYSDIGLPKVEAAVTNLTKHNPFIKFEPVGMSINEDNALELLRGSDLLIDGLDSMTARRAVNTASYALKIPYVYAGAIEYYANISTFIPNETGCLYCLVGDLKDNPANTCANVGVSPVLLSVAASIEVQEAVALATGRNPKLAGRLMHIDIQTLGFDSFEIARSEKCPVCSLSDIPEPSESKEISITQLCTQSFSISPAKRKELNLADLDIRLRDKHKTLKRNSSILVKFESGASMTLMSTGAAVIKGVKNEAEALTLYKTIAGD